MRPSNHVRLRGEIAYVGHGARGSLHDGRGIKPRGTRGRLCKLSGKLAKGKVRGVAFNESESGGIPESGGAAHREDNFVAFWQREESA